MYYGPHALHTLSSFSSNIIHTDAMSPKFGDGHSLKRYALELLAGVTFDVYDQHAQIITELDIKLTDIKLNKWHITIAKLCCC